MNILTSMAIGALVGWGSTMLTAGQGRNLINIPAGIVGALTGSLLLADSLGTSNALGISVISAVVVVAIVQTVLNPPRNTGPRKRW